ncbi:MAG: hypothetical protein ACLPQS_05850 [Acidimicrobiales bacterium]
MIKRLDLSRSQRGHPLWPEDEKGDGQLFSPRRPPLRQMVVLVDHELVSPLSVSEADSFDERNVLMELLASKLIRRFHFADDGPPPDAATRSPVPGVVIHPDWVVLAPQSTEGSWGVIFSTSETSYSLAGVIGNAPTIAERDTSTDAYAELTPAQAGERRRADVLAAQVAVQGIEADVYITEREFLHKRGSYATRGITIATPREALSIIGLYLRTQGEFRVFADLTFNRGLFYWVGTRDLLSSGWRWFTACVQHSSGSGDESLMLLAGSLLQRVDRSLEMRDHIHVALNQKQNHDLQEDELVALDMILVSFMAAFDVCARVAHRVLALGGDEYLVAWQKKGRRGWWERVSAAEPALAAVVAAGSQGDQLLTIVHLLRNSVHGAALQGLAYVESASPQVTMVGLPSDDQARLLLAMDSVGGRHAWGVQEVLPGRAHVDPGVLVDRLFETVIPLLNELMDRTPVERLPHVNLQPSDLEPPTGGLPNPFELRVRQRIRWQLGF